MRDRTSPLAGLMSLRDPRSGRLGFVPKGPRRARARRTANSVPRNPLRKSLARSDRAPLVVLIASPTAGIRRRWGQGLTGNLAIHEVTGRAVMERDLAALKPAILLLDLALSRLGGVGVVPALQRLSPRTRIILFSGTPREGEGIAALKAGAKGYCEKAIDPVLLGKAVETVQKGEIWVGRSLIPYLLEELASLTLRPLRNAPTRSDLRLERLTPRELEVAFMIGEGASNKEIADRLGITQRTVKAHLTSIFRKLDLSDRVRLALFVSKHSVVAW